MNLLHLIAKRDRNLLLGKAVTPITITNAGRIYGGLSLPVGVDGSVRLRTPLCWYPFSSYADNAGWLAIAHASDWNAVNDNPSMIEITATLVDRDGQTVSEQKSSIGFTPTAIRLPRWPTTLSRAANQTLDLVIVNSSTSGQPIEMLISEQVPVRPLYDQARGVGVEIGPGPSPRILPRPHRQVFYVERETAEEFKAKYSFKGKFDSLDSPEALAFWEQVIVGRANDLPMADKSLNFIFSADVIEHLVNPIGHLEYWRSKLKRGGRVLAIIPAINGCSDYINQPTKIADWLAEYDRGGYVETVDHHRPYAEVRGLSPEALMQKGFSSHFSFFTPQNLSEMLDVAVARFGYTSYHIEYGLNSKKIYFTLIA